MSKSNECPECGAIIPQQTRRCPACGTLIAKLKREVRASRERRYVYGRRKQKMSQEAIWVIVIIILGILIVMTSQLIAFMRARKLVHLPCQYAQVYVMDSCTPNSSVRAHMLPYRLSATPGNTLCLTFTRPGRVVKNTLSVGITVCNYLPRHQQSAIGSHHRRNVKT